MDIRSKIVSLRKEKKLTQQQFADALGVSRGYVANIEREGGQEPSFSFIKRLLATFDIDANSIFGFDTKQSVSKRNTDFFPIRRYAVTASAGDGIWVEGEEGEGSYAFSRRWLERRNLNPAQLSVISVAGDSMEPELYDNDLVLINHAETGVTDGKTFVLRDADQLFVKKLQMIPGGMLHLISVNKGYPVIPIDLKQENQTLQVIGRVVASMHEW